VYPIFIAADEARQLQRQHVWVLGLLDSHGDYPLALYELSMSTSLCLRGVVLSWRTVSVLSI
jgi:hypothetical protein